MLITATTLIMLTTSAPQTAHPSRLAVIDKAPTIALSDQSGAKVTTSELNGKVLLVSFIFTTCSGSCPATTHRMCLVQRELKRHDLLRDNRVRLISITLDPQRDTPEVLKEYMRRYEVDAESWCFLTGTPPEVNKTIAAWGMWAKPAADGQLDHPSRIFLVDPKGSIREIYNLDFLQDHAVVEDIKLLLHER